MRGWHLTPTQNVESIRTIGLQPYTIRKDWLPPGVIQGIWTWQQRPEGDNLIGMILQRVLDHHTWQVSLLSYEFDVNDCYPGGTDDSPDTWTVFHDGSFYGNPPHEGWKYHEQEPAYILLAPVAPSAIRVEAQFNLEQIIG